MMWNDIKKIVGDPLTAVFFGLIVFIMILGSVFLYQSLKTTNKPISISISKSNLEIDRIMKQIGY